MAMSAICIQNRDLNTDTWVMSDLSGQLTMKYILIWITYLMASFTPLWVKSNNLSWQEVRCCLSVSTTGIFSLGVSKGVSPHLKYLLANCLSLLGKCLISWVQRSYGWAETFLSTAIGHHRTSLTKLFITNLWTFQ